MNEQEIQRLKRVAKEQTPQLPDYLIDEVVDEMIEEMDNGAIPVNCSVEVDVTVMEGDVFEETHVHDKPDGYVAHLVPGDGQEFDAMMDEFFDKLVMDLVSEIEEEEGIEP